MANGQKLKQGRLPRRYAPRNDDLFNFAFNGAQRPSPPFPKGDLGGM